MSRRKKHPYRWGDKVFFEGRKTPLRVIGYRQWNGEPAVEVTKKFTDANRFGMMTARHPLGPATKTRTEHLVHAVVQVGNLRKAKGGYQECYRQSEMFDEMDMITEAVKEDVS